MDKRVRLQDHQAVQASQGTSTAYAEIVSSMAELVRSDRYGWAPALTIPLALGLLLVALSNHASQQGSGLADWLFWIGLVLLVLPPAVRLASSQASRNERILVVAMFAVAVYLVKVMHSPFAFTFADELVHAYNAEQVRQTGTLFSENPILQVTPLYPGLSVVTATLANLTGMSVFRSGLVLIGVARLINLLTLYFLFERLSRSSRVAGIAALLYAANSNFLFWSAQYAYESLALPLALLVLYLWALHLDPDEGLPTTGSLLSLILLVWTVTVTHHMTTAALMAFLVVLSLLEIGVKIYYREGQVVSWLLTGVVLLFAGMWLFYIASSTLDYIMPVVGNAFSSTLSLITSSEQEARIPFGTSSGVSEFPLWEQAVGFGSILIIAVGIVYGLLYIWQRHRRSPIVLTLGLAALIYLPMQLLRFTGSGWETANRSSEFLFVGIALVLALAFVNYRITQSDARRLVVASGLMLVLVAGGLITGWSRSLRLSQPYQVAAIAARGIEVIEPPGVAAARWTRQYLGPQNRFATDPSNVRLLLLYGEQFALAGSRYGVRDLLLSEQLDRGELEVLQVTGVEYVALAGPSARWNDMSGLYFLRKGQEMRMIPPAAFEKFNQNPNVSRVLDTGDIVIYDLRGLRAAALLD